MTNRERVAAAAEGIQAVAELVGAIAGAVMLADSLGGGMVRRWWDRLGADPVPEPDPEPVGVARDAERVLREHERKE